MGPADQDVPGHAVKRSVRRKVQPDTILVDLSSEPFPKLGVERLGVSAYLLPGLLSADRSVGLGDLILAIRQYQDIFVNFRHLFPTLPLVRYYFMSSANRSRLER
jgi:hypothetical protein